MASHGRRGLSRLLLGSQANKVVSLSATPACSSAGNGAILQEGTFDARSPHRTCVRLDSVAGRRCSRAQPKSLLLLVGELLCQAARLFLDRAQAADTKIEVRDFEVEDNLNNAILLSRVYERIGIPDFNVLPLFVIGTHIGHWPRRYGRA